MSTTTNARTSADSSRRPSTTSGTKPRVPSSRLAAKERGLSSGEVIPEDSASNPPHRRTASGTSKVNGSIRGISQRRTKSPVKTPVGDEEEDRIPSDLPSRQGSRANERPAPAPREEKKALRESH